MPQVMEDSVESEDLLLARAALVSERPAPVLSTHGLVDGLLLAMLGEDGYPAAPRRVLAAGLAASTVADLGLRRRVCIDGDRLLVTDRTPTGDPILDPVLDALTLRHRAPRVERCLEDLSLDWTILGRAGACLEARQLVRIERRALHPLIMHRFHPVPAGASADHRALLRSILAGERQAVPRELALASLAAAAGVLREGGRALADSRPAPSGALRTLDAIVGEVMAAVRPPLSACAQGRRPEAPAALGVRPA